MSRWVEVLRGVLLLTEEVKRMNHALERLEGRVLDIDRRLVRVETLLEQAGAGRPASPQGDGA